MGALNPKFTDSFEVWTGNYGDFIGNIVRPHVKESCTHATGVDQPVLPPEEKIPKLWFHVVLRNETTSLTLAIRMDNLYLVGFRTPSGVWWEFNNDEKTHLIPGSTFLGFGASYDDLIGRDGELQAVTLGQARMSHAVDSLAKYPTEVILEDDEDADPHKKPKRMLASLVIMVCEGLRFYTVTCTVTTEFKKAVTITKDEATNVNYWDKISKAVLTNDFSGVEKETGIMDREGAKKIIALLKYQKSRDENKDDRTSTSGVTVLA